MIFYSVAVSIDYLGVVKENNYVILTLVNMTDKTKNLTGFLAPIVPDGCVYFTLIPDQYFTILMNFSLHSHRDDGNEATSKHVLILSLFPYGQCIEYHLIILYKIIDLIIIVSADT